MKQTVLLFIMLFLSLGTYAQGQSDDPVQEYIQKYKAIAIRQQLESGVPAAITLAQGICETGAGRSELCRNANNHFGIKCKHDWTGATYAYSDDAPDECFRKYPTALASYKDHSAFLRNNPRYARLFELDPRDYKAWARGLKRCGYATSSSYASRLIAYIEKYDLEQYTTLALAHPSGKNASSIASAEEPTSESGGMPVVTVTDAGAAHLGYSAASDGTSDTGAVVHFYETMEKNGMKGFYAPKGDWLLEYAIKHRIRYSRLLAWNDLKDEALPANLFIYLEPKRKVGLHPTHTVQPGETLLQISQEEGIQLDQLMIFNQILPGEQPVPGEELALQHLRTEKPKVYELAAGEERSRTTHRSTAPAPGEYVPTDRPAPTLEQPQQQSVSVAPPADQVADTQPVVRKEVAQASGQQNGATEHKNAAVSAVRPVVPVAATAQPAVEMQQKKETDSEKETPPTPLEKLRAYMDQVVYSEKQEEKDQQQKATQAPKTITTLPAGRSGSPSAKQPAASTSRFYTVKRGDTAYGIAKRFHISLDQLKKWNQLPASMTVMVGQRLRVAP